VTTVRLALVLVLLATTPLAGRAQIVNDFTETFSGGGFDHPEVVDVAENITIENGAAGLGWNGRLEYEYSLNEEGFTIQIELNDLSCPRFEIAVHGFWWGRVDGPGSVVLSANELEEGFSFPGISGIHATGQRTLGPDTLMVSSPGDDTGYTSARTNTLAEIVRPGLRPQRISIRGHDLRIDSIEISTYPVTNEATSWGSVKALYGE